MSLPALEPITLLLLLAFLMALLLVLSVWFLLTLSSSPPPREPQEPWEDLPLRPLQPASNDDWRGVKTQRSSVKREPGDPFERFTRNKNDDLEF